VVSTVPPRALLKAELILETCIVSIPQDANCGIAERLGMPAASAAKGLTTNFVCVKLILSHQNK
jgi:hypothetical protein